MTQEDRKLLLQDLCARLPYGVICQIYDPQQDYGEDIFDARLIHIDAWTSHCYFWGCSETDPYKIEQLKPYLRPMSSMTDGELVEFLEIRGMNLNSEELKTFREGKTAIVSKLPSYSRHIDWLNAHHFDYRGLIEKGLAIAIDENNNPY